MRSSSAAGGSVIDPDGGALHYGTPDSEYSGVHCLGRADAAADANRYRAFKD